MKKKFLKVFSVFLVLISLFSLLPTGAVEYTITLGKEEDNETYFISVEKNNAEKKLNIAKVPYGYENFFNQDLPSQKIDTKNIDSVNIRRKVDRALKDNTKEIKSPETIYAILKQFFYKTFNKTMVGYIDQQERAAGRIECKYVAQRVTNLIPKIFKLPTPFGEAEMEFRLGKKQNSNNADQDDCERYYDIFIKGTSLPSEKYVYLCNVIDAFVNNKKDFAKIMQDYLALTYNPEYDDKDLSHTLERIRRDEQLKNIQKKVNEFFENEKNFVEINAIIENLNKTNEKYSVEKYSVEKLIKKYYLDENKNSSDELIISFNENWKQRFKKQKLLKNYDEAKKDAKKDGQKYKRLINNIATNFTEKDIKETKENIEKLNQEIKKIATNIINNNTEIKNEILKNLKEDTLKKVANVLSAVLFVSEPGPNRAGDGGKSARSPLKYIIDDKYKEKDYSFYNVFVDDNGNGPLYPVTVNAKKSKIAGTEIARMRSHGNNDLDEKINKVYYNLEENYSDDEYGDIDEDDQALKKKRREVKNQIAEWIQHADPVQIGKFEKNFEKFLEKQSVKTEN